MDWLYASGNVICTWDPSASWKTIDSSRLRGQCSVFPSVMVSQVWPQEEMQERLQKTSLLHSQVLETGGTAHHTGPHRGKSPLVGQEEKGVGQEGRESLGRGFYWNFLW